MRLSEIFILGIVFYLAQVIKGCGYVSIHLIAYIGPVEERMRICRHTAYKPEYDYYQDTDNKLYSPFFYKHIGVEAVHNQFCADGCYNEETDRNYPTHDFGPGRQKEMQRFSGSPATYTGECNKECRAEKFFVVVLSHEFIAWKGFDKMDDTDCS